MAHAVPQILPSQVATWLGPAGHAVQLEPQDDGELDARHDEPQAWKPSRQENPHEPPEQNAAPLPGAAQVAQVGPHAEASLFEWQEPPQRL